MADTDETVVQPPGGDAPPTPEPKEPDTPPAPEPVDDDDSDYDPDKDGEEVVAAIKDIKSPPRGQRKPAGQVLKEMGHLNPDFAHVFRKTHETYRKRGAVLTEREKALQANEQAIARREAELARREADLAGSFKEAGFDAIPAPPAPAADGTPTYEERMEAALAKQDMKEFFAVQKEWIEATANAKLSVMADPLRKANESLQARQAQAEMERRAATTASLIKKAKDDGYDFKDLKPIIDELAWPDSSDRARVAKGERVPMAIPFETAMELAQARIDKARRQAEKGRATTTLRARAESAANVGGGTSGRAIPAPPTDAKSLRPWIEARRRENFTEPEILSALRKAGMA